MAKRKLITIASIRKKALLADQTFLEDNFIIKEGNLVRVQVASSANQQLLATLDGEDFVSFNNAIAIKSEGFYLYEFTVSVGDTINFKMGGAAASTLISLDVDLYLDI